MINLQNPCIISDAATTMDRSKSKTKVGICLFTFGARRIPLVTKQVMTNFVCKLRTNKRSKYEIMLKEKSIFAYRKQGHQRMAHSHPSL